MSRSFPLATLAPLLAAWVACSNPSASPSLPAPAPLSGDLRHWAPAWKVEFPNSEQWGLAAQSWSGHAYFVKDQAHAVLDASSGHFTVEPGRAPTKASTADVDPRFLLTFVDHQRGGLSPHLVSVDARDGGLHVDRSLETDGLFSHCILVWQLGGLDTTRSVDGDRLLARRCHSAMDRLKHRLGMTHESQRVKSGEPFDGGRETIERWRGVDGERVWSVPHYSFNTPQYGDGVILRDKMYLEAVDAATGAVLWNGMGDYAAKLKLGVSGDPIEWGMPVGSASVAGVAAQLFVGGIRRFDLRTGVAMSDVATAGSYRAVVGDLALYADEQAQAHAYELRTGRERWTMPDADVNRGQWDDGSVAIMAGATERGESGGFNVLDLRSGEVLFRSPEDLSFVGVLPTPQGPVVLAYGDGAKLSAWRPAPVAASP